MPREPRPPAFGRILRGLRMPRRSTPPHSRSTLLLMVLAIALPTQPARSQDRAMQDRLDRLERDLSMLQRQVYRSGGAVVPAGSSAAVDAELRMDRVETEMRELTGRVEDAINGVEQLRRRLEQINSDIDVRLGQGQGQPTTSAPPPRSAGGGAVASAAAGTLSTIFRRCGPRADGRVNSLGCVTGLSWRRSTISCPQLLSCFDHGG